MSCTQWRIIRRPDYLDDLNTIEAWIAADNPIAAVSTWLLIDEQVDKLADPNFPRRRSARMADVFELVAHPNYVVYFDQNEAICTVTVLTVVHVARQFPTQLPRA